MDTETQWLHYEPCAAPRCAGSRKPGRIDTPVIRKARGDRVVGPALNRLFICSFDYHSRSLYGYHGRTGANGDNKGTILSPALSRCALSPLFIYRSFVERDGATGTGIPPSRERVTIADLRQDPPSSPDLSKGTQLSLSLFLFPPCFDADSTHTHTD